MSQERFVRAHVCISGLVQGLFFRQETARAARARDVAGWVRNLPDGRVEAAFEGNPEAVAAMVAWVRIGPPMAGVAEVQVRWEQPDGRDDFRVRL